MQLTTLIVPALFSTAALAVPLLPRLNAMEITNFVIVPASNSYTFHITSAGNGDNEPVIDTDCSITIDGESTLGCGDSGVWAHVYDGYADPTVVELLVFHYWPVNQITIGRITFPTQPGVPMDFSVESDVGMSLSF
jgi:hypothetical protein